MSNSYVALARVSTGNQKEGHSKEVQLETINSYGSGQGWRCVKEIFDVVSGSDDAYENRKGLQEALRLLEKDEADYLIVYDSSRIGREDVSFSRFLSDVYGAGGKLGVATERRLFMSEIEAKEQLHWTKAVSGYEYMQIQRRTQSGKKAAMLKGSFVWPTPFGYRTVSTKADDGSTIKVLGIEPLEADMVTRIFERYIAGDGKGEIVRDFNTWSEKSLGGKYKFSLVGLSKMIGRIHLYAGGSEERTVTLLGEDITVTVDFPAIISEKTKQEVLKADAFRADGGPTNEITAPYKPIAFCQCGENFQVVETRILDDGTVNRRYICSSFQRQKGRTLTNLDLLDEPTDCRYSISVKALDKAVLRFLKSTKTDDFVSSFKGWLEYLRANLEHLYPNTIRRYKESIEKDQKEYDALFDKLMQSQNFAAVAEEINSRLKALKERIEESQGVVDKMESNYPRLESLVNYYEQDEMTVQETSDTVQKTIAAIESNDYETANELMYDLGIRASVDLTKTPARHHITVGLDYSRILDSAVGDDITEDFVLNLG